MLVLAVIAVTVQASVSHAQTWMEAVGLPVAGYNGSGVLVAIVSTGVDLTQSDLAQSVVSVDGYYCAVSIASDGSVSLLAPPYDIVGVGTEQARLVTEAAPGVKLLVVRVPYELNATTGLPEVPGPALRAALEWLQHPYLPLPNGTIVECPLDQFKAKIVLLGLPVYTNYTLNTQLRSLLEQLTGAYLVVTPVGDIGPGIVNNLALAEGVVSVGKEPPRASPLPGYSGGFKLFNLTEPTSLYRDLPLDPDYVMPVDQACAEQPTVSTLTCSEAAAAEYVGLAAVAAQMYYELRGVPPAPYQLELLIRATVTDKGQPSKDTLYGWGVPNAETAYYTLLANMGFEVCAPSYTRSGVALVELQSKDDPELHYGVVMRRSECVRLWAPVAGQAQPGYYYTYTVRVYGPPGLKPYTGDYTVVPGLWRTVLALPSSGAMLVLRASVTDEKGVALTGAAMLLPLDLSVVNAREALLALRPLGVEAGLLHASVYCDYLRDAFGDTRFYLLVRIPGYIARVLSVSASCVTTETVELGKLVMTPAPSVYVVGVGPGAEEDAALLRYMGFKVRLSSLPPPDVTPYDLIVLHASASRVSPLTSLVGRVGLILEGDAGIPAGCTTYKVEYVESTALQVAEPLYQPEYNPVIRRGALLYTLYGLTGELRLYNVTGVASSSLILLSALSGVGRIVEAYYDPATRVACLANTWSMWRLGRSLEAATPVALAVYATLAAGVAHRVVVYLNGTVAIQAQPLDNLTVSVFGWRLSVTLWDEASGERLASFTAPYPNYQANLNMTVGVLPAGDYRIVANDSLWGLGVAVYHVVPKLVPLERIVLAGSILDLLGLGFRASAPITITIDGVVVATARSEANGTMRARIPVPSILEPGGHVVAASDGVYTASARIEVGVLRTLQLSVSVPSIVEYGRRPEGIVIVRMGVEYVDANVTVVLGALRVTASRVAKGVYTFTLPVLPPGTYTLIINATYTSRLVNATGVAAVSFSVVQRTQPATPRDIEELTRQLSSKLDNIASSISEKMSMLEDRVERLDRELLGIRRGLNESCTRITGELRDVIARVENVRVTLLNEIRKVYSETGNLYARIEALVNKAARDVEDTAKKMVEQVRGDIVALHSRIAREIGAINATMSGKLAEIESSVKSYNMYVLVSLALLGFDTALLIALVLRARRG